MNYEFFTYMHYSKMDATSSTHAIYIEGWGCNSTTFSNKNYLQSLYNMRGLIFANFAGKYNIPVF